MLETVIAEWKILLLSQKADRKTCILHEIDLLLQISFLVHSSFKLDTW